MEAHQRGLFFPAAEQVLPLSLVSSNIAEQAGYFQAAAAAHLVHTQFFILGLNQGHRQFPKLQL